MKIGIPKEIKNNENRVGLTPENVLTLVNDGNEVFVETKCGMGIGISDTEYIKAGAKILESLEEVYEKAKMIIKVKEPQMREIKCLTSDHILYTYLHLAADKPQTEGLIKSGATCVAYETIQLLDGSLPLLAPMSEVAGRMATQMGAFYLQKHLGGKGILMGGVPGTKRANVVILGAGVAGTNALEMAVGLEANVTILDVDMNKLRYLDAIYRNQITTLYSNSGNIEDSIKNADLVIGTVLIPGAKAPKLVKREHLTMMKKGTVVVDVAIDQGGCFETSHPTTHKEPIFFIDNILHYCVANMPGAYAKTSTYALNNSTLKYARAIAKNGIKKACEQYLELKSGVNIYKGKLVYEQVALDLNLPCYIFKI